MQMQHAWLQALVQSGLPLDFGRLIADTHQLLARPGLLIEFWVHVG